MDHGSTKVFHRFLNLAMLQFAVVLRRMSAKYLFYLMLNFRYLVLKWRLGYCGFCSERLSEKLVASYLCSNP